MFKKEMKRSLVMFVSLPRIGVFRQPKPYAPVPGHSPRQHLEMADWLHCIADAAAV